jgi:outer membrane protein OmpA-like peptidoglycan-associated protein
VSPTRLGAGVCLAAGLADLLAINLWLGPKVLAEPPPAATASASAAPPVRASAAATEPRATSSAPRAEPNATAAEVEERIVVYFAFDSTVVPAEAHAALASLARRVSAAPEARVTVTAYADPRGGESYNASLIEARAQAVAQALARLGVSASLITTRAGGAVEGGTDPTGNIRARRAEVLVSRGAGASR